MEKSCRKCAPKASPRPFFYSGKQPKTTSLNLLKSTRTVFNLPTFESSTFVFRLFKLVGTLTNLLISSLSTSVLKQ